MIPAITRYASTRDLLVSAQHQARHRLGQPRPRVIAAWRQLDELPAPGTDAMDAFADDLDTYLSRFRPERDRRPGRSRDVWHCTIRAHPDSSPLSDERWAEAARRVLAATGIAPVGDEDACRWLALRVDTHEIRIIAPLMRRDGQLPRLHRDISQALAACQLLERETRPGADPRRVAATASPPGSRPRTSPPQSTRTWDTPQPVGPARHPR